MRRFLFNCTVLFISGLFTFWGSPSNASEVPSSILTAISNAGDLQKYPDANAIIIFDSSEVVFRKDGQYQDWQHRLVKVLTEAGKKQMGESHFPYYRVYGNIRIALARVIKPDGVAIDVPAEMIKDISESSTAQMNIYDEDTREKVVTFKNLEIGDAIEYVIIDSVFRAPMDDEYCDMRIFQETNPILQKVYSVTGPKDIPIKYAIRDGKVEFSIKEGEKYSTYIWQSENVDRIVREPAMPALIELAPRVIVSTIDSWEDVSKWYFEMSQPKLELDDSLRMAVKTLTQNCTSEREKIFKIYHFVAQKVRYMGLGTGVKKGFEPKPVTETYHTKYGVCRDVAALMTAMLNEAQIPANIVLTGAGYEMEKEIPNYLFNHAIVAMKDDDGNYYYADPTVENCPDLLVSVEHDQDVLVCRVEGEQLLRTPSMPAEENMGYLTANSVVNPQGDLSSELTFTTDGYYDIAFRSWCKRMPPQQIQMIWQQVLQGIYTGARLTHFEISDTEDLYQPFTMKIKFDIKDYALKADKYMLVKLPLSTGQFELLSRSVFRTANLPERRYPWKIGTTFGAREQETLIYPDGYKIKAVPNEENLAEGDVSYNMDYQSTRLGEPAGKSAVTYQKELKINSKQLSTEEYKKFKEILRASAKSGRGEVILVREESD
jgi:hypothetical protein